MRTLAVILDCFALVCFVMAGICWTCETRAKNRAIRAYKHTILTLKTPERKNA